MCFDQAKVTKTTRLFLVRSSRLQHIFLVYIVRNCFSPLDLEKFEIETILYGPLIKREPNSLKLLFKNYIKLKMSGKK